MKSIKSIKNLIAKDQLRQALHEILTMTKNGDSNDYNIAILLSLDLHSFEETKIKGLFNREDENREKRSIAERMLNLLDKIQLDLSIKKPNGWQRIFQYILNY